MAEKDPWDFSAFGGDPNSDSTRSDSTRPSDPLASNRPASDAPASSRQPATASSGFDDLGSAASELPPTELTLDAERRSDWIARPPVRWLAISAGLSAIGLALAALLGGLPPAAVIGWALCGPLAIGALAVYTSGDTRQRAHPVYVAPNWLQVGYLGCLLLCLIGVIAHAIRIGLWVGRW